jgi:peptidyl-prolyl cis-trans isomerase-like protein 2
MSAKDIIRLHMARNNEGLWHCPVTFKTFTNNSVIAAIKSTGNVFSMDAINELNIKTKNFVDLISGETFRKSDIMILQDPSNPEIMSKRDISNFEHLKQLRAEASVARASEGTVRHNPATAEVMQEITKRLDEPNSLAANTNPALLTSKSSYIEDVTDVQFLLDLHATVEDVFPGRVITDQRAGESLTSTYNDVSTSNAMRLATADDLREARWKKMRQVLT